MSKESKEKLVEEVENLSEDEEMICLYTELSDRELTYNTMIADLEDEREKLQNERDNLENEKDKLKEEGIKEQSIVIVKTMLKKGYKIDEISEITGLSKEDINELK